MGIAEARRVIAALAIGVAMVLSVLALWHAYWAFGGSVAKTVAIPEFNGAATISPSRVGTLVVAGALFTAAALVASVGGVVTAPVPHAPLLWCADILAGVFALRAIGDFRLLGFFKRVRGTRFATMDTLVYAPLCLALAAAIFAIAHAN